MIFATVGTQRFPFDRMLKMVDALAGSLEGEEIFMQTGCGGYVPKHCQYKDFLPRREFEEKMRSASLLITHGGVGAIVAALQQNKPVIVVPRLRKHGEHVDDHQLEIAGAFGKKKMILVCGETERLEPLVEKSRSFRFHQYESRQGRMLAVIGEFLEGMQESD